MSTFPSSVAKHRGDHKVKDFSCQLPARKQNQIFVTTLKVFTIESAGTVIMTK